MHRQGKTMVGPQGGGTLEPEIQRGNIVDVMPLKLPF